MKKLKVGIVGLRRGVIYIDCFEVLNNCEVVAFCDKDEKIIEKLKKERKDSLFFVSYEEFLKSDIDIVVVAVPAPLHAKFSILALESGKHVLSEVPTINLIEEAEPLYKAVKKSGKKYMLAQNTCYWAHIQAWKEIVRKGMIGKVMYAEAEYIHDIREWVKEQVKEGITWRATLNPLHYCTHSLGPLLTIMEDRCKFAQGFKTEERLEIPGIKETAPKMEVGIFKTEKGAVIKILIGFGVSRKPSFHYYSIYGTKGCLETNRVGEEKTYAYFEDIPNLNQMMTIPITAGYGDIKITGTHGGTEYLLVKDFVESIIENKEPPINIEKALNFSLPGICAHISAEKNGGVIEVPEFKI